MHFRTVLINYFRLTYSRGSFTVTLAELRTDFSHGNPIFNSHSAHFVLNTTPFIWINHLFIIICIYLAYRTRQSNILTVIRNSVLPYHVTCFSPITCSTEPISQRYKPSYSVACNICRFYIAYRFGQPFEFTMIGNPSFCRF